MIDLQDRGYQDLATAIVLFAIEDWRYAQLQLRRPSLASKRALEASRSCEKFFRSPWFETLAGVDGKIVLRRLKE